MSWRVAKSLNVLLEQYNALYPGRNKAYDGSIGDARHQASKSDHNPGPDGIVQARDYTATKAQGDVLAAAALATLKARGQKGYVIWNWRIANPSVQNGAWRKYNGSNGHTHHVHVSVHTQLDTTKAWLLGKSGKVATPTKNPTGKPGLLIEDGDLGPATRRAMEWYLHRVQDGSWNRDDVRAMQEWAGRTRTGQFSKDDVRAIQKKVGAKIDGAWGPNTTLGLQRFLNKRIKEKA